MKHNKESDPAVAPRRGRPPQRRGKKKRSISQRRKCYWKRIPSETSNKVSPLYEKIRVNF